MRYALLLLTALFAVSVLIVPAAIAADYQPKPLPATSEHIGPRWNKDLAAYYQSTISDVYQRIGDHDPRWDPPALSYLATWQGIWSSGTMPRPSAQLLAEADAIIALGCKDPLILYLSGRCLTALRRHTEALQRYRQAWKGFLAAEYEPGQRAYGSWRVCQTIMALNGGVTEGMAPAVRAELNEVFTAGQRYGRAMLTAPIFADRPDHCLYQVFDLFSDKKVAQEAFLQEVVAAAQAPGVDPWLSLMLQGNWEITLAWRARGNQYADQVTAEGWEGFRTHLANARTHLEKAHRLRPDLPEAATKLIKVAMADDQDAPRRWFDAAVAAQFDHIPAYEALEYALMPRWRGSLEEEATFAKECLMTRRFDTMVPMRYLEVWQSIVGDDGNRDVSIWQKAEAFIADDLERLFVGMAVARKERPADVRWYQSLRVVAAVACERKATAVKVARTLNEPIEARAWEVFFLVPAAAQAKLTQWMDETVQPP